MEKYESGDRAVIEAMKALPIGERVIVELLVSDDGRSWRRTRERIGATVMAMPTVQEFDYTDWLNVMPDFPDPEEDGPGNNHPRLIPLLPQVKKIKNDREIQTRYLVSRRFPYGQPSGFNF